MKDASPRARRTWRGGGEWSNPLQPDRNTFLSGCVYEPAHSFVSWLVAKSRFAIAADAFRI